MQALKKIGNYILASRSQILVQIVANFRASLYVGMF